MNSAPTKSREPILEQCKSRVRRVGRRLRAVTNAFPRRVECNVCGWSGRDFLSDGWHDHTLCPRCDSQVRHRLLVALLEQGVANTSWPDLVRGKRVLHFAPEPPLVRWLRPPAAKYVTADLYIGGCDLRLDLADMRAVSDRSFDVLMACDVLEHVPDDRRALSEIRRVLAPGGIAVLAVPQKDRLEITYEDPSLATPGERERAFGISNHYRIYGTDFATRLADTGFAVTVADHTALPPDQVARHVLFPPVLSPHPLATNHRRIYFARTPQPGT